MSTVVHPIQGINYKFDHCATFPENGKAATSQKTIFDDVPMTLPHAGSKAVPSLHFDSEAAPVPCPNSETASSPQIWNLSAIRRQGNVQEQSEVLAGVATAGAEGASTDNRGAFRRGGLTPAEELRQAVTAMSNSTMNDAAADLARPKGKIEYYGSSFLRDLVSTDTRPSSQQIAGTLADLVRQSGIEGYAALRTDFIEKLLFRRFYALPIETLRGLTWLTDTNSQYRRAVLLAAGNILSKGSNGNTPSGHVIGSQLKAAQVLLDYIGRLAQYSATYKTEYKP